MEGFEGEEVVCHAGALTAADAATVELLAHIHLFWKRLGRPVRVVEAPNDLECLIGLMGLSDVLAVETRGQSEEWEELLGVQEETDARHRTVRDL